MTATETAERLLDDLLDKFCSSCGQALPQPGQPCMSCGSLPTVTRTEAAERLAEPGKVAQILAAQERAQATAGLEIVRGHLRDADRAEYVATLEQVRDEAATRAEVARAEATRLAGELESAQSAERDAAAREEDSRDDFTRLSKALETAQRTGASHSTRTQARALVTAGAPELEADQAALRTATANRERAEQSLASANAHATRCEAELGAAQQAVDEPGRAPKSAATLAMDLAHQVQTGDLTEAEQGAVRDLCEALATMAGAAEGIATRAIAAHEQAQQKRARAQAMFTQPLGNGNVAAIANPLTAGKPTP